MNQEILRLAIPSIISNITVPLLGLVDLTITGHMGSQLYIGAIAVGSMIFNIIYWLFGFLRMGTSGMTAQAFGQGNTARQWLILGKALKTGGLIGLSFVLMQIPLAWLAITLMGPSAELVPLVRTYFNICIWGAPAMLCIYGLNGWFIGLQNTRIPMSVAIIQNVVNILASILFVFVFHMKIEGVAFGTLIAEWSGVMMLLYHAMKWRGKNKQLLDIYQDENHGEMMRQFFTVNRDIFLRTLCLVSVNMSFTAIGARMGNDILSANALLMTFFTLFSYVMDGFAYAGEALAGKYYGANNNQGLHIMVSNLFAWGFAMMIAFMIVYAVGGSSFLHLLTNDEPTIAVAMEYYWWAVAVPLVGMAAFVYDGIFIGLTESKGMLVSSAIAAIVYFSVYFYTEGWLANHALWLAFILYLATRGLVQAFIWRRIEV